MLPPDTLLQNRYRIVRLLAQGGMGAVYLAQDQRLGNEVALKQTFFTSNDPRLREQFHREARLLSRLRHTALPRVIDHFIEDNGQFLVMDYITGKDLQELLIESGGPFPVSKVLNWADQLLDVLGYLHTQDEPVIHRDIKPANMKLTPKGKVILLDFGLAKGASSSLLMSLPAATMGYAPIEQVMMKGTDSRSDLYSLGVTLYHLMTNTLPPTALQRQEALLKGSPDPSPMANEVNPRVPVAVARVLAEAMALDADDRPQTAARMRELLRVSIAIQTSRDEEPTEPHRRLNPPPDVCRAAEAVKSRETFPHQSQPAAQAKADVASPEITAPEPVLNARVTSPDHEESGRSVRRIWLTGGSLVLLVAIVILAMLALPGNNVDDFGLEMVGIPAGAFMMGSPNNEAGRESDEGPQHQVKVSSFYIAKFEVTQSQWRTVATKRPRVRIDLKPDPSDFKGDNLPVENVSWEEAIEFCERLSKATGEKYRLPTEAEWEYACRAGTTGMYAGDLDSMSWYGSNSDGRTHPVGTKQPNGFGLYDMHGNVWEWCMDWYSENYYGQDPSADPIGPSSGSARVTRGGGWSWRAEACRSADRGGNAPGYRVSNLGFRLVRTLN